MPWVILIVLVIGTLYSEGFHLARFEASPKGQNYLYRMKDEYKSFLEETKGKPCIMVNTHEAHFLFNLEDYKNFSKTAFVHVDDLDKLKDTSPIEGEEEVILYINDALDCDKVCEDIVERFDFDGYNYVMSSNDRNWAAVYKLYRN